MNRSKFSVVTMLSVCLLVASTSAISTAMADSPPVIVSASAEVIGDDVVITGTVTGDDMTTIEVMDVNSAASAGPDANGNFTITYFDMGLEEAALVASDATGSSQQEDVTIAISTVNDPAIASATAKIVGANVVITGTVTGNMATMTIVDAVSLGTASPDANGNFTITYLDNGETYAELTATDTKGVSESVPVIIEE